MNFSPSRTVAILKKEFIQLIRDRTTFGMIIMLPIMQLLLFGYAINNDPKNLNTAVLSRDNSVLTRSFVTGLKNSEYFCINKEITSEEEGRRVLQEGKSQFVITIPENFSKDLIRGNVPSILMEADATDPTATSGAIAALNGILASVFERDLKGALLFLRNSSIPIKVDIHKLYNPEGFTHYNIIPGLIGVLLSITGIMMTALSITRERERGTMENMLSMPIMPLEVMIGKIVPYIFVGYIQAAVIVSTAYLLFDVPILGSVMLLALIMLVFIICNLTLGFAISAMAKNQMQAMQMTIMSFLPSIMLSGFMFPFYGMPQWAQIIGNCLPMTYFIRIARGIILKGSNFSEISSNLWPLLIFFLITSIFTMKFYKKTLD